MEILEFLEVFKSSKLSEAFVPEIISAVSAVLMQYGLRHAEYRASIASRRQKNLERPAVARSRLEQRRGRRRHFSATAAAADCPEARDRVR